MSSDIARPDGSPGLESEVESGTEKLEVLDKSSPEDRDDYIDPDATPEQEPDSPEHQKASNMEKFSSQNTGWTYPGRRW
ncbi:hypothetical protein KMS_R33920 [Pseudomonas sp. LRP2-20]|uniref:hypothetical protein n=1 Tax=Pseudomonas sp. LRP2-20 TaxID=2944234 RepID=UPI00218C2AB0|nr:hypothetical protein [Pseudomonas sp. LRP2-20]BDM23635.1 hypothetical protein KMS_R33920 [Pseudomonas sp. LRP2-20]